MADTLARQGSATAQPWSLTRDNQVRSQHEQTARDLYGAGVVSGGAVTLVSGYTVQVAAGTKVYSGGVTLTLAAAQSYNPAVANATVYLWGLLKRTAATQTLPATSDTYALEITHNLTGTPGSDEHFPLAILYTDGAGVNKIDDDPPGKYLRGLPNEGVREIALTGNLTLTAAQYRDRTLEFTGSGAIVTFPSEAGRHWRVVNESSGTITAKTAAGLGVDIPAGETFSIYTDGTDILPGEESTGDVSTDLADLQEEHEDLARKFRILLLHLTAHVGIDLHPDLEDDFSLAVAEA